MRARSLAFHCTEAYPRVSSTAEIAPYTGCIHNSTLVVYWPFSRFACCHISSLLGFIRLVRSIVEKVACQAQDAHHAGGILKPPPCQLGTDSCTHNGHAISCDIGAKVSGKDCALTPPISGPLSVPITTRPQTATVKASRHHTGSGLSRK